MPFTNRSKPGEFHLKTHDFCELVDSHVITGAKNPKSPFSVNDVILVGRDIANDLSLPNGWDISRGGKLMPKILS
jgi:hypothetical protein